jgi:hypothetical protein
MSSLSKSKARDVVSATMIMRPSVEPETAQAKGYYVVECFAPDGSLKWEARSKNLVVNVGLADMCNKYFAGAAYTAAWFVGLYGAAASNNPAAGDTMSSHAGWTEVVPYSNATRVAATFGTATTANPSVITTQLAPAVFNINAIGVIGGAFLTSNSTKSGTTGTLYSAADLQSPGDRNVANGDTVNVTYRFELTAT